MASLTPVQMVGAVLAVLLAFVAVAGQERAVVGHMGIDLDKRRGARAAMAAAAVSRAEGAAKGFRKLWRRDALRAAAAARSVRLSIFVSLLLCFIDLITTPAGRRFQSCSGDQITVVTAWSSRCLESREQASHMSEVAEDAACGFQLTAALRGQTE